MRGVFHYNIRDQSRPTVQKINPIENSRDHVLALAWSKTHNVLFIHDSSGNILQYDKLSNSTSVFYKTGKLSNQLDVSPGCTIKLSESESSLFVLSDYNKITILQNVRRNAFGGMIELSISPSEQICDFKTIGDDKVLVLHLSNKLALYGFN